MSRQGKIDTPKIEDGPLVAPADDDRLSLDLRLNLDEVATAEIELLRHSARRAPTSNELTRLACKIYDARRKRDRIIGTGLFGEPGWDMLLALYCLPKRGHLLSVSSLSYAAEATESTGLRWQKTLMEEGLIERGPKEVDQRKQFMRLTSKGRALLELYLTRLYYVDAQVDPKPDTDPD